MPDDSLTPFSRLAGVLQQLGLPAMLIPASDESPVEQLLVSIDEATPPDQDSRYVLQMFFPSDVAEAARLAASQPPNEDETAILQFMMSLGMQVPPDRQLEVYRLMSLFNRMLPVGAFDLTEEDVVYLRYALLADTKTDITIPQVVEVLELLGFFVPHMAPAIAAVLSGEQTREQAIEATERVLFEAARLPED
ncbi:MAG: YbjN domain-containing protein [Candidatus Sericytochromatia bacterium]